MKEHRSFSFAAWIVAFLFVISARAEEKPSQLLTALDSTTVSGFVNTSVIIPAVANGARRALVEGLYSAQVTGPKNARHFKLALAVFSDGTGFCELGEYDSISQRLTNYCVGNFTNRSNGIITGKFGELRARFIGRASKDKNAATLRLSIRRGSHEHLRVVRLERAGDIPALSTSVETSDPVVGAPEPNVEVRDSGVEVHRQVIITHREPGSSLGRILPPSRQPIP